MTGGLAVADGGTLAFDIFSDLLFDTLLISGAADFGLSSLIDFDLTRALGNPYGGSSVTFLSAGGGLTGLANLGFSFTGLDPLYAASVAQNDNFLALTVALRPTGTVPEPATLALFGVSLFGFAGFGLATRRRRKTH